MRGIRRGLLCGGAAIAIGAASPAAAITLITSNDAFGLANTLFLNLPGLVVNSASLSTGALTAGSSLFQTATYTNLAGTYGLPASGIALSTGNVNDYATGPNTSGSKSTGFGPSNSGQPATVGQNALLQPITGQGAHFDVVQLDIGFFNNSVSTSATFFATFGSEEWPEFVGSSFNDGFGLLVNGVNVAGVQPTGGGANLPVNINHPDMRAIAGTELDGILAPNGNPVLRFDVPINPAAANTFTIVLGDAGDGAYDTTVYLSSFLTGGGGTPGLGATEFDPILPANPPDPVTGAFVIELPAAPPGQTLWIDPPANVVGYEYDLIDAATGVGFASVTAPSLATVPDLDGYVIHVGDESAPLAAGATLDFAAVFGVTPGFFKLLGIDFALGLDPADVLAFPTGIALTGGSAGASVVMTPVVQPIPLPASAALYLGVIAAAGGLAWRRRRATA